MCPYTTLDELHFVAIHQPVLYRLAAMGDWSHLLKPLPHEAAAMRRRVQKELKWHPALKTQIAELAAKYETSIAELVHRCILDRRVHEEAGARRLIETIGRPPEGGRGRTARVCVYWNGEFLKQLQAMAELCRENLNELILKAIADARLNEEATVRRLLRIPETEKLSTQENVAA
jgi:hypothetical protein